MKKIKIYLLILWALFFSLSGKSFGNEKVNLQLKWYHQFQFAGYYAAVEKGFYEDVGLDVNIISGGLAIKVDEEVLSGRAEYGVLASELIGKRVYGKKLVLLSVIFQHSIRTLITRADSEIYSPSCLIGHTIMLNPNEKEEFLAMFRDEGIGPEKINIIPKDKSAIDKLINKEVVAINGSVANQPFILAQKGISVRLIRPIAYGIDFYGDSVFTSVRELNQHPERTLAFRQASLKGWRYAMQNTEEIVQLIHHKYSQKKSIQQLRFEAQELRKVILPELVDLGHINYHRIEKTAKIYEQYMIIKKGYSLDGFVFDPIQKEKDFSDKLWKILTIFVIVLISIAIIILMWVILLKKTVANRTASLSKEIIIRKKTEEQLKASDNLLREVINSVEKAIAVYEPVRNGDDFVFLEMNEFAEKITQYKVENVLGKTVSTLFPGEANIGLIEKLKETYLTGNSTQIPLMQYKDDRMTQWVEYYIFKLPSGKVVAMFEDTYLMRKAEEKIKTNLKEKETLLQEIHHRVKNNMQVLYSLLKLQSINIEDSQAKEILKECQNRVFAMSAVHEILYRSENLSEIDMGGYLSRISSAISQTYADNPQNIQTQIETNQIKLNIKIASPLGLIVNELLSNSYKYAFPNQAKGKIEIIMSTPDNKMIELIVMDNGIGTPDDFEWKNTNSLGLKLVQTLAENQLDGSMSIDNRSGTQFTIKFNTENI